MLMQKNPHAYADFNTRKPRRDPRSTETTTRVLRWFIAAKDIECELSEPWEKSATASRFSDWNQLHAMQHAPIKQTRLMYTGFIQVSIRFSTTEKNLKDIDYVELRPNAILNEKTILMHVLIDSIA
jgi:hypothetical protein